jgi:hypothetical protein
VSDTFIIGTRKVITISGPGYRPLAGGSASRASNKRFAGLTVQGPKQSYNTPAGGTQVLDVDLEVDQKQRAEETATGMSSDRVELFTKVGDPRLSTVEKLANALEVQVKNLL